MIPRGRSLLLALSLCVSFGCGGKSDASDPPNDGGDRGVVDAGALPDADVPSESDAAEPSPELICEPVEAPCADQHVATLMLRDTPSGGQLAEEGEKPGEFLTHVDATAGGTGGMAGYTYARFTERGLERVDLSDEQALESMDWDIAFRRFMIRLNSGVSGPSCVKGAPAGEDTTFDALTAVPDGLTLESEQYFAGESCALVQDDSGIGSPKTVLSGFWSYPGCVSMTGKVYVLLLATGRHVKLEVLSYYAPDVQKSCDEGMALGDTSSAGNVRVRWAPLD